MNQNPFRTSWLSIGASALATFGAVGVASAVTFNQTGSAARNNTSGETFDEMSAFATTFCYLTRVRTEDTDAGKTENASCRLDVNASGNWVLVAALGSSSDADVACSARCYNN